MANEPLSIMFREFLTEVQHSGRHGRQNELQLEYNIFGVLCLQWVGHCWTRSMSRSRSYQTGLQINAKTYGRAWRKVSRSW